MKHVHAEWVRLWLDGVDVEYKTFSKWWSVTNLADFDKYGTEFRFKPAPKPKIIKHVTLQLEEDVVTLYSDLECWSHCHTLKLTFNGETGNLITAEVLK